MTHEGAVDLDVGEGKTLEVEEGAEAGSEVVQCPGAAQVGQPLREGRGGFEVDDRRSLGDLEDHGAGRDVATLHLGCDEALELRVADRQPGQVHLDPAGGLLPQPPPQLAEGRLHDPAVDLADQPVPLGQREELPRQDDAAVGGHEAQQQLAARHGPVGQALDRLGPQLEATVVQGRP